MNLPSQFDLPISSLAACFNNTSATYKFYWFLAILNRVESNEIEIRKDDLFADMVALAWFPINYFHVSFGKQDKLQRAIMQIKEAEGLPIYADHKQISKRLSTSNNSDTLRNLHYFNAEVPHRFLSPWFNANSLKTVYRLSQRFENDCLYALFDNRIEINPKWVSYLKLNAGILRAFCYWHLTLYLQAKNPNVPDIPNKLRRRSIRRPLTEQRKFWDIVISELGSVNCIYTSRPLCIGNYAVDHFIPYAFVAHDLIWNLIPIDRNFNSTKGDKLPLLDRYFDLFFELQQTAIKIVKQRISTNKLLEDYLTIFPELTEELDRQKFLDQLQPLITIASNNGFQFMK